MGKKISLYLSLAVLVGTLCAVLFPQLLGTVDPYEVHPENAMNPPFHHSFLGTDESGRDIYSRIIYGARPAMLIGILASCIALGGGLLLALCANLGGRKTDWVISRIIEVGFAFPGILLALLIIALVGPGMWPCLISVGVSAMPGYARIMRATMREILQSDYVEAYRVMGRSRWHIVRHTLLPNTIGPLCALFTLSIGQTIVWASALAFLGLGAPPPLPEWGAMLSAGRTYMLTGGWWLTVVPGTAILLIALATTHVGKTIQESRRNRAGVE